jgi:hypothetical protein
LENFYFLLILSCPISIPIMKTKTLLPILFCCGIFLSQPTSSANNEILKVKGGHSYEEYDPSYFYKFQSVGSIINDADQKFGKGNRNLDYYNHIATILRKRFYHGFSHYSFSENALASFSGMAWNHLSAIVIPEDILKHPKAACSQQAIVLMEIFRRTQTDFRKVSLEDHFVVEGFIDNEWRLFDTNIEPDIIADRKSFEYYVASNSLGQAYKKTQISGALINKWSREHSYGEVNEVPAKKALLFHQIGFWLQTQFLFVAFLFWVFIWMFLYSNNKFGLKRF